MTTRIKPTYTFRDGLIADHESEPPQLAGYIFSLQGAGFGPNGEQGDWTLQQIAEHNGNLASIEWVQLQEHGRGILYVTDPKDGPVTVGDWNGTHKVHVLRTKRGSHNIAGRRLDVWFTAGERRVWHGVNIGDNQILRCKRTKESV